MLAIILKNILIATLIVGLGCTISALSAYQYFFQASADDTAMVDNLQVDSLDLEHTSLDSLQQWFGQNKKIPPTVARECLLALARFPELRETKIDFAYAPISFTMISQPNPWTLFGRFSHRKYKIYINSDARSTNLDYQELSLKGKIGWLGHELGHIYDYERMNTVQLAGMGLSYYEDSFRKTVEHRTDQNAIRHGFGDELAEAMDFVVQRANPRYLQVQDEYYMTAQEIRISNRLRSWVLRNQKRKEERRARRRQRYTP